MKNVAWRSLVAGTCLVVGVAAVSGCTSSSKTISTSALTATGSSKKAAIKQKKSNAKMGKTTSKGQPNKRISSGSSRSSLTNGWKLVTNGRWRDVSGDWITYTHGVLKWSDDNGQSWYESDGTWEGENGVWYMLDAHRTLSVSRSPRGGKWNVVSTGIWVDGHGAAFKIDARGKLWTQS